MSATATVLGVIYADRTWEGSDILNVFGQRALKGKALAKAAALFAPYPASLSVFRSTIQAARALDPGRIDLILYEKFLLSQSVATK